FGKNSLESLIHPRRQNNRENVEVKLIATPSFAPDNEITPGNKYCPGLCAVQNVGKSVAMSAGSGNNTQFKCPSKVPRQARKPHPGSEKIDGGLRMETVPNVMQIATAAIIAA